MNSSTFYMFAVLYLHFSYKADKFAKYLSRFVKANYPIKLVASGNYNDRSGCLFPE